MPVGEGVLSNTVTRFTTLKYVMNFRPCAGFSLVCEWPLLAAISTGQRNTDVKPLCRVLNSRVLQGRSLSWRATLVQVSWRIP
jgi:hypothetical protein